MIRKATTKEIKYACEKFHYSKAVPSCKYAYSYFNRAGEWCGVVIYSVGANRNIGKAYGMFMGEVLELVRVALNGKQEHTSQVVSETLHRIHHDAPNVKLIVSYADHRQKHIGTIYQATNWIYLGVAEYATKQYFYKGKWTHQRTIDSLSNKDQLKRELQSREASAKFKYVYCFDKRLRRRFQKHAKPYPKDGDLQICSGQVEERASS